MTASTSTAPPSPSFESVSELLLSEGFLLTALELHAELAERGRTSRRLREFFENSDNFDRCEKKGGKKKTSMEV